MTTEGLIEDAAHLISAQKVGPRAQSKDRQDRVSKVRKLGCKPFTPIALLKPYTASQITKGCSKRGLHPLFLVETGQLNT